MRADIINNVFLISKHKFIIFLTIWDYMFLKTLKEKKKKLFDLSLIYLLRRFGNTFIQLQDFCQINISGDWYEVSG